MGANFSRLKTWTDDETLTNEDLNAEFDNMLSNFIPAGMDDYSSTVGQMQIQTNPGELGSEVPATSLAGELARIRWILSEITGNTYWYQSPAKSLASGSYSPAFILPFEGFGVNEVYSNLLSRGVNPFALLPTATPNGFLPENLTATYKKRGGASLDLTAARPLVYPGSYSNPLRGTIGVWFRNVGTSQVLALNLVAGIQLWVNASGKLEAKFYEQTPSSETAKSTTVLTGTTTVVGNSNWQLAIMSWDVGEASTAGVNSIYLYLNGVLETSVTNETIVVPNTTSGGKWIFGQGINDPAWGHYSSMSVLPASEAVNPWTAASGGSGAMSVSNGVLTIGSVGGVGYANISRTDFAASAFSSGLTLEMDMKLNSSSFTPASNTEDYGMQIRVRDDAGNQSVIINIQPDCINICSDAGYVYYSIENNSMDWHRYRICLSSGPTIKIYVDGVKVCDVTGNSTVFADVTAGNLLQIGSKTATAVMNASVGYIAIHNSDTAPLTGTYTGQTEEIFLLKNCITNTLNDSAFALSAYNNGAVVAIGQDVVNKPSNRPEIFDLAERSTTGSAYKYVVPGATSSYLGDNGRVAFWSDGKNPIDLNMQGSIAVSNAAGATYISIGIEALSTGLYPDVDDGGTYHILGLPAEYYKSYAAVIGSTLVLPFNINKRVTLKPGLYILRPMLMTANGAHTAYMYNTKYKVSRG